MNGKRGNWNRALVLLLIVLALIIPVAGCTGGPTGRNGDEHGNLPDASREAVGGQRDVPSPEESKDREQADGTGEPDMEEHEVTVHAASGQEAPREGRRPEAGSPDSGDRPGEVVEAEEEHPGDDMLTLRIIGLDEQEILGEVQVPVEPGDTVLDVLVRGTRSRKIHLDIRGRGSGGYVMGIDNLYEFDHGPSSGWMYCLNGVFPDRGAGSTPVSPGDRIGWLYTQDAGRDVGARS